MMKYIAVFITYSFLLFGIIAYCFSNCKGTLIVEPIVFQTKNQEFKYTAYPNKGKGFEMMEKQFFLFKKENPEFEKLMLYRVSMKNYFNICAWNRYKIMPEWNYPSLPLWYRFF